MAIMRPIERLVRHRSGTRLRWLGALAALGALAVVAVPGGAAAGDDHGQRNVYDQANLVSDINGVARIADANLVNPWGMAAGPNTPLWVADNNANVSTIYSGGVRGSIPKIVPLVVAIPGGAPTGIVFNPTNDFIVHAGSASGSAKFIFDSENGEITAWSPTVPPATQAQVEFTSPTAVYKGLAIASNGQGTFIYAANFHDATVDVFDKNFAPVTLSGSFTDPNIPTGFAPFDIQELGGKLYVTYALQKPDKHDDMAGPGNGFVDVYDTSGHLLRRLISHGDLNSPWGLALAPDRFGAFSGDLLVGNFGDGAIHAYDPSTGAPEGQLMNQDGNPIVIDDLWALRFGNGITGTRHTLLFTAGIVDEMHGLFGEITASNRDH
jgi:uncharacterized protein (TIGR03118 family)